MESSENIIKTYKILNENIELNRHSEGTDVAVIACNCFAICERTGSAVWLTLKYSSGEVSSSLYLFGIFLFAIFVWHFFSFFVLILSLAVVETSPFSSLHQL